MVTDRTLDLYLVKVLCAPKRFSTHLISRLLYGYKDYRIALLVYV